MCYNVFVACVAELVDAHDSKSCGFSRVGSIPTTSTSLIVIRTRNSSFFLNFKLHGRKAVEYIDNILCFVDLLFMYILKWYESVNVNIKCHKNVIVKMSQF